MTPGPSEPRRIVVGASAGGEADHIALSLPAHNRRGVRIACEVSCAPLRDGGGTVTRAIVLMEEQPAPGEA